MLAAITIPALPVLLEEVADRPLISALALTAILAVKIAIAAITIIIIIIIIIIAHLMGKLAIIAATTAAGRPKEFANSCASLSLHVIIVHVVIINIIVHDFCGKHATLRVPIGYILHIHIHIHILIHVHREHIRSGTAYGIPRVSGERVSINRRTRCIHIRVHSLCREHALLTLSLHGVIVRRVEANFIDVVVSFIVRTAAACIG